jgi:hypothetical protein
MNNNHYVYFHINLVSNEVFYVGKGKGRRAWKKTSRSEHWYNVVNKYGYRVDIIHDNLSEKRAFDWEKLYISMFGRKNLVNHTDGGEGQSNPSDETRKKMSNIHKGKIISEETRKKISDSTKGKKPNNYGIKVSNETRKKLSEINKGENNSFYGKTHSDESRKKMSEARKLYFQNKKNQLQLITE